MSKLKYKKSPTELCIQLDFQIWLQASFSYNRQTQLVEVDSYYFTDEQDKEVAIQLLPFDGLSLLVEQAESEIVSHISHYYDDLENAYIERVTMDRYDRREDAQ